MSYIPPMVIEPISIDLSKLIDLLETNNECCATNAKYIIAINDRLNRYDIIFREIMKCCNYISTGGNTGVILPNNPVIPGQIVSPPPQVRPTPKPTEPSNLNPGMVVNSINRPIRETNIESYDTGYIPNAPIIDIPGSYKVVGDRFVNKVGTDLKTYLPYYLNIKKDDVILEAILDYRIVDGGGLYPRKEVILVYQTKNTRTTVRNIYEAGVNHYRSWWKIHR